MSVPHGDDGFLHELESEVEAGVALAGTSHPEKVLDLPVTDWLFDPADAGREQIGLRGLLGAVQALEGGSRSDPHHDR